MSADATGAPTREAIRDALLNAIEENDGWLAEAKRVEAASMAATYGRDAKTLRWLSESIVGLLEDRDRLEWLLSVPVLGVTLIDKDGSISRDHFICTMWGARIARIDLDHIRTHGVVADEEVLSAARLERRAARTASLSEDSANG